MSLALFAPFLAVGIVIATIFGGCPRAIRVYQRCDLPRGNG